MTGPICKVCRPSRAKAKQTLFSRQMARVGGLGVARRVEHQTQPVPLIKSAAFSPTIMLGALVLPEGMVGKMEASATRRLIMP